MILDCDAIGAILRTSLSSWNLKHSFAALLAIIGAVLLPLLFKRVLAMCVVFLRRTIRMCEKTLA
jgi:hypothetical protein